MDKGQKKLISIFLTAFIFSSAGCHTVSTIHPKHGTGADQIHAELQSDIANNQRKLNKRRVVPRSVNDALIPALDSSLSASRDSSERHFTLTAKNIDTRAFFMQLMEGTSSNIVVSPEVTGTISLNLKEVTLEQALEAVRDAYGFEIHKTDYGYEVMPPSLATKIFNVNYLDVKRSGKSFTALSSGQISEKLGTVSAGNSYGGTTTPSQGTGSTPSAEPSGSTVDTRSEADFWRDLQKTLQVIIGDKGGRTVIVNPQAGVVIVHAYPAELKQMARYLDRLQTNLSRQVILEAKILEVELRDQYQAGIDWNLIGKAIDSAGLPSSGGVAQIASGTFTNTDLKDFVPIFALNINGDFGTMIKLLQSQGNIQVLSNPRISTVNNQKAVIKVGQDEFFVTGVSTQSPVVSGSLVTAPTQNVDLTPFFSGVTLDVTPQISSDGSVVLHIHPSISTVKEQQKNIVLGTSTVTTTGTTPSNNTYTLPLALSTIRESDNIVHAQSGQVVVIGGLMQNIMAEEVGGVPVISKMPVIGPFFRRTSQIARKTELVILLRPVLADRGAFTDQMKEADRTFGNVSRGFHTGGLPEVFGNEGEESISRGPRSHNKFKE